jgi:Membrane-associated phospholipid phosphatase
MLTEDLKHPLQTLRTAFPRDAVIATLLSVGMAFALSSIIFFAWIAGEVFEGDTAAFDDSIRLYVHTFAGQHTTSAMIFLSFLGSTIFLTGASVVIALLFVWLRRYRSAILFSATMLGASILNYVLKIAFARTRPIPYFDLPAPESFSFPSGHALCSACFYGVLAWLFATRANSLASRILAWFAAGMMIFLIGLSRIYLGVHYPSDVIAGYLAATFWALAVILVDTTREKGKTLSVR